MQNIFLYDILLSFVSNMFLNQFSNSNNSYLYDWPIRIKTAECSCTGPLLPMRVTFGVLKQTKRQISSECVHSVGFRWPKTTILLPYMFAAHKYNEKP